MRPTTAVKIASVLVCFLIAPCLRSVEPARPQKSDLEIANAILDRAHAFRLPQKPLKCEVGFDLVDVVRIDEAKETYTIDFYMWIRWPDSRLRFQPAEFGLEGKDPEENFVHLPPGAVWDSDRPSNPKIWDTDRLWNPKIELMNLVETKILGEDLRLEPEGYCEYTVRQVGVFKFASEGSAFKRFPFDEQKLPITLESFRWDKNHVEFQVRGDQAFQDRQREKLKSPEWKILTVQTAVADKDYEDDSGTTRFSEASIKVTIKREAGFYLWRICLPLFVLVVIAMSIVWIPRTHPEARMIISVTTLVAVTTFSIVVNTDLPHLPYLTLMDVWMLVSFILSACGAIENVVVGYMEHHERVLRAHRIDYHSRWIAPSVYLVATVVSLVVYLYSSGCR